MRINNCHLDKSDFNSQLSISMKGGGERGGGGFLCSVSLFPRMNWTSECLFMLMKNLKNL